MYWHCRSILLDSLIKINLSTIMFNFLSSCPKKFILERTKELPLRPSGCPRLVYSKSGYNTRIGQRVRLSGRLHDHFRKESQIVVKFSTQFSLINISVEFEDEPDWTSPSWVIAKILIVPYGFSLGRSIYRRSCKKLFYQSRIKPHLLYTIR